MKKAILFVAAVGLVIGSGHLADAGSPSVEVGAKAPEFQLTSSAGEPRSLAGSDAPKVLIFYRGLW